MQYLFCQTGFGLRLVFAQNSISGDSYASRSNHSSLMQLKERLLYRVMWLVCATRRLVWFHLALNPEKRTWKTITLFSTPCCVPETSSSSRHVFWTNNMKFYSSECAIDISDEIFSLKILWKIKELDKCMVLVWNTQMIAPYAGWLASPDMKISRIPLFEVRTWRAFERLTSDICWMLAGRALKYPLFSLSLLFYEVSYFR
jgi:hypothetical protein